jgi:glutathione peroxidase
MSIYDVSIQALDGTPADLTQYKDQAVLLVNENLQKKYGAKGFTVLGVPCNQFLGQEPGTAEEIQEFCSSTYGVTFPLTEKIEVNGDGRHPLYEQLVEQPDAEGHTGDIRWNFEKFVIAPGGEVVARFNPTIDPEAPEVVETIERTLP